MTGPVARQLSAAGRDAVLALADDEICMGHWYATWVGLGPFLEEDLATTSIGQDELGHARALYALLEDGGAGAAGDDLGVDGLAFGRSPDQYRCSWLAELRAERWEDLFVRHLLYDEAESVRWEALTGSTVAGLGAVAARALTEEVYHVRHARSVFSRLMAGGPGARDRLEASLLRLMPLAATLFEPTDGDAQAVAEGVVASSAEAQGVEWRGRVESVLAESGVQLTWPSASGERQGRHGVRSPGFADMHAEMTRVYALDPSARW